LTNSTFWIVLTAVALAGAWIFLALPPDPIETIEFEAHDPWIIGNADDAFSYAGDSVRAVQGAAALEINPEAAPHCRHC